MATDRKLQIIIEAQDRASSVMQRAATKAEDMGTKIARAMDRAMIPSAALAGTLAFGAKSVLSASAELQNSLLGLARVAEAVGIEQEDATVAAQKLAEDGLMTVKEAAESLKNLLSTGFSLDQAIHLMNALRDSAAFNRQGMLGFGEAIVGATQGLKNQNSIMVDNAGITKNLSVILKEAGYSQNDLGLITSDTAVRTALYNGILKEASIFQGDAAEMAQTYSGRLSQLESDIFNAKAALGDQLSPIMLKVIQLTSAIISKTDTLINTFKENKVAALILAGAVVGALIPSLYGVAAAGAAAALALKPFIVGGAAIAGMLQFVDFVSKRYTGFGLFDQVIALLDLMKIQVDRAVQAFDRLQQKFREFSNSRYNVIKQIQALPQWIDMQFAHGGVVPGSPDQPVPIIAHGGERIISRTGTDVNGGMGSGSVTVNFNGDMSIRSEQDINTLAIEISRVLGRQSELARRGVGR